MGLSRHRKPSTVRSVDAEKPLRLRDGVEQTPRPRSRCRGGTVMVVLAGAAHGRVGDVHALRLASEWPVKNPSHELRAPAGVGGLNAGEVVFLGPIPIVPGSEDMPATVVVYYDESWLRCSPRPDPRLRGSTGRSADGRWSGRNP